MPCKILLADDDQRFAATLGMVLKWAGYDVVTAEHGIDAILQVQRNVPDLILYELTLPHVPGYDFLAMIRSRYPHVGVIGMSRTLPSDTVLDGVLVDDMFIKGQGTGEELLQKILDLLQTMGTWKPQHQKNATQSFRASQRARRAASAR